MSRRLGRGWLRPGISEIEPYEPIVPLEVLADEVGLPVEALVKLDANENPYGPSPRVKEALASYPFYHIYPDPEQRGLRQALSSYTGLSPEHIVAGSGSDELLDLVARLALEPGDKVINCVPTFGMYPFITAVCGGQVVPVLRREDYSVNVAGVKAAVDARARLIYVASPNNPTGNTIPEADVRELLETGLLVVVDEAYYEFSGETVAPLVKEYPNLAVTRTFSKWAGLAGLRVGYGLFPGEMARAIMRIKPPYNVNEAAQVAAQASLADLGYLQGIVRAIMEERERLFAALSEFSSLKPFPSKANFIFCQVLDGVASDIYRALRRRGIFVRYYSSPELRQSLRITVGKPEHTRALVGALKEVTK